MTATAEVIDEREESTAEANGKEKKQRIGLWDGNVFVFGADKEAEAKAHKIYNENKAEVENFRQYTVKDGKGNAVAFAFGRNAEDAMGRFAMFKGYTAAPSYAKQGRVATPKIDANMVNALKLMWGNNLKAGVLDFLKAEPQYCVHFELTAEEKAAVMSGVVEE